MAGLVQRRELLRLAGVGGVVFASGLAGVGRAQPAQDFFFVQMSDSHWGYQGPANPQAKVTLPKAVAALNGLSASPDFIVFTGDLTHNTDDPFERRLRMREFKDIVGQLKVKTLYLMPGEHDAGLDWGTAFREIFGPTRYAFAHKGVNFIVLDNVSDPRGQLGEDQLAWLKGHLATLPPQVPIVVFTHRPLFDLRPDWDWFTRDGGRAIELLAAYPNVTVFYGHIHQENHHMTGHIAHHSAKSLIFPLPSPDTKGPGGEAAAEGIGPKRKPVGWSPAKPFGGLGFRAVEAGAAPGGFSIAEYSVTGAKEADA
jgi:hypothetical protein